MILVSEDELCNLMGGFENYRDFFLVNIFFRMMLICFLRYKLVLFSEIKVIIYKR